MLLSISSEMTDTEHKNSVKGDSFEIELPAINELRLFVQCLNEESACSVSYETAAWQSTVSVNAKDYVAPTRQSVEYTDSTTTDTYTIKNDKYNVYKSKSGAFYIWKTSKKTSKKYKYYLPKDIQIQMGRKYKENNK